MDLMATGTSVQWIPGVGHDAEGVDNLLTIPHRRYSGRWCTRPRREPHARFSERVFRFLFPAIIVTNGRRSAPAHAKLQSQSSGSGP